MDSTLFSCKGKCIIVLGGHGLIGFEMTRALYEHGAEIIVIDVNPDPKRTIDSNKIKYIYVEKTTKAVNLQLEKLTSERNDIYGLLNSAYPRTSDWGKKFENIPLESWEENMNIQLGLNFSSCQIMAEYFKKNQIQGSIVNIASTYGIVGPDFSVYGDTHMTMPAAYSAIKGGLINFTRYLATYYGKFGIRANCISPGGVFDSQPEEFVRRYSEKTPLGRMARANEMAGAAVYLMSDASSYITGQNIVVDGGWTAW